MGLWLVGSVGGALLAALADSTLVFAVIVGAWSSVLGQFFLGGIARIVAAHLQGEAVVGARAAWSFLARRWLTVLVGGSVATLGVSAVVGVFLLIVMGITRSVGDLGGYFGALMIVPTWLVLVFAIPSLWNCQLLAVVMGVEDCGILTGLKKLLGKNPLWMASTLFQVFENIWSRVLASLLLTALAAAATFFVTTQSFSLDALFASSLRNLIAQASYALIAAAWMGFVAATVATEFTLQYYNRSGSL